MSTWLLLCSLVVESEIECSVVREVDLLDVRRLRFVIAIPSFVCATESALFVGAKTDEVGWRGVRVRLRVVLADTTDDD